MIGTLRGITLLLVVVAMAFGQDRLPPGYRIVNPFTCKARQMFRLNCNYCGCMQYGKISMCTRMGCGLRDGECIPNSYFSINGKFCMCPASAYKWDSKCFSKPKIN